MSRSSHLCLVENDEQKSKEGETPENSDSSNSSSSSSSSGTSGGGSSSSSSSGSSSSSDVINVANSCSRASSNCKRQESSTVCRATSAEGTSQMMPKSGMLCRTNTTQTLEFAAGTGSGTEVGTYHIPSKSSNRLEYVSDIPYRLSAKIASENRDSPWRYMPVVKRVQLAMQPAVVQKDESDMATEQVGNALHVVDGEVEDGSQDRRAFLSDIKFVSLGRKAGVAANSLHVHPNIIHTYRKVESETEDKRRIEKLERMEMHQKMVRLERELRLQKSLSEECEDLGVDEPSTSELFPEADLLLDPNSSPSFEHTIQDASCSQAVETAEPYSGSNFRNEYSSSSQEGSHENPSVDNQVCEDLETRHETKSFGSKKSYSDWKYRSTGKERGRYNTPVNVRGEKLSGQVDVAQGNSSGQNCSLNNASKNISRSSLSLEETMNRASKCDAREGAAARLVFDPSGEHTIESASDKFNRNGRPLISDQKTSLPETSILAKTLSVTPRPALSHTNTVIEESQNSGPKQVLPVTASVSSESNVEPKVDLPVTSSSEDSVTLDSFATSMAASSLDVTIPSPVPTTLSLPATLLESSSARESLSSLTAARKFTYTYGKKLPSSRQEVDRAIKQAKLNRPYQYFNDHVDSQETWDSSSSQDKIGADDEDSDELSPSSRLSSQVDEGANTDVDVVEVSNDELSSSALACVQSTSFPLLPAVPKKVPDSSPGSTDGTLKLSSTNGVDSIEEKSLTDCEKRPPSKKNRLVKRFFNEDGTDRDHIGSNAKRGRTREGHRFEQSGLLHNKKFKGIPSLSKVSVLTKESAVVSPSLDTSYKKQQGLRSKQRGGRDGCEERSVDPFSHMLTSTSMAENNTVPAPDEEGLILKVHLEDKDECPSGGTCESHLKPTRSSRRRGHIKKCQCCSGSPERPKKKKHIVKVEKSIKKGQSPKQIGKMGITKKR